MRHQLAEVLPEIEVLDGTAEAIPFGDAAFDVVTVAQAFHWINFEEALAEIRRGSPSTAAAWPSCSTSVMSGTSG